MDHSSGFVRAVCRALAPALCAFVGMAWAQTPATRIGIFCNRPACIAIGRRLGVRYQRYTMPVEAPNQAQLAKLLAAEAAGFKIDVQFNNVVPRTATGARFGPVTDVASYQRALAVDLDATHPDLVTIQNEEDGLEFWSGTPADYLRELADAVQVAHAKGYRVANGGLSATGVKLAYWHHLWLTGQRAAADRFAAEALSPDVTHGHAVAADLPSSAEPNRPILGENALMRFKLGRVETLIAGYRASGADYVNFHWYQSGPDSLRDVATWLGATTGLPVICNEMGQDSQDPRTVDALLSEVEALRLPYVFWFAIDGHGAAVGLTNSGGALRPNGAAFRDFVAAHP